MIEKRQVTANISPLCGVMTAGRTIDPILRHHKERTKMAIGHDGKPATTHLRVLAKYHAHSKIQATLESGRTHQIRVHLAHIHYPIIGDKTYNKRLAISKAPVKFN